MALDGPVQMFRKDAVLTRRQVESLIADDHIIIIVHGKVLKVDAWLKYHPGGDKAIMHMVGRDATDEVTVGLENTRETEKWDDASSDESDSPPPSPIFDSSDPLNDLRLRRQNESSHLYESSSVSSLSSEEMPEMSYKKRPSHIDTYTRQEIDLDLARYPALDSATQDDIAQRYRQLHTKIQAEGLYQCNYGAYMFEICRYIFLFAMCFVCLHFERYGFAGLFLGLFWHQLVFSAHDAGHMGITHSFTYDTIIGIIIADFFGGLSLGWWKRNHNVHHIVTNSPEHDPDIEHMPFFAISHRFFQSLRSTYYDRIMKCDAFAKFAIKHQHLLYYPVLTLGRFNLYRLSWQHLLFGLGPKKGPAWWHRWFELAGHIFFWSWYGYGIIYKTIPDAGNRFLFVMVSHMVTGPLHVQITLSHFAMSTADLGIHESFPQKMLRTTMDIECPEWLDFLHGGLQFQAIHHLYPRIPRHNLRRTQKLVQEFCREVGIPYALYGFVNGNKEVIGRLADVGRQAAILAYCQKTIVENEGFGSH
ncbi:MAG: hypothetical protein LQ342_002243 [Letrouitia transgressa]|nr:MAG: hypothetical protein LQ342_002243 [Letrouitia transgressa]